MLIFQIVFVISAVLTLIPGRWTENTIIRNLSNALVSEAQKRKLRASIHLDYASAGLLLLSWGPLSCTCPSGGGGMVLGLQSLYVLILTISPRT